MAHGGKITVNSKLGNGSNFIAFIPFKKIKRKSSLDMVE
jgi:signal transduction histidine kinase